MLNYDSYLWGLHVALKAIWDFMQHCYINYKSSGWLGITAFRYNYQSNKISKLL